MDRPIRYRVLLKLVKKYGVYEDRRRGKGSEEKETFRVTDDYAESAALPLVCREADVILIDVQTPVDENHVPTYNSLRQVSEQAGAYLQPGTLVIWEMNPLKWRI